MDFILDNLAIGNYHEALETSCDTCDINALLCVAQEKDIYETKHLYHKVPIIDMQPIPTEQLKEAVEWIRDNISNHKILVFCNAGVGRSPSVVVAYLCCISGYTFGNAVEYVATRKPYMSILPNLINNIEEARKQICPLSY
jgi:protein-tyrosine phosphatase